MAEQVNQPAFPDLSGGVDYTKYTVEGVHFGLVLVADPENTRGGEIAGEPYVQPSLFMHILKSLRPGAIRKLF